MTGFVFEHRRLGGLGGPPVDAMECPKCGAFSGDDWSQCGGFCPMQGSPHFVPSRDNLGDRMKAYEATETHRAFSPDLPVYVRIDGRGFSRFTKGMDRPYDLRMQHAMIRTAQALVGHAHAAIGYTQSDEISLVFPANSEGIFFAGKTQKLVSVLAGYATTAFCRVLSETEWGRGYFNRMPHFDARVFQLPDESEATNAVLWRIKDAERNSVQMLAQANFSHAALQRKPTPVLKGMLAEKGIDYAGYPDAFRRGTLLKRVTQERMLTDDERRLIPVSQRPLAGTLFMRSNIESIAFPEQITWAWLMDTIFGA